jgi:hypothetical protein
MARTAKFRCYMIGLVAEIADPDELRALDVAGQAFGVDMRKHDRIAVAGDDHRRRLDLGVARRDTRHIGLEIGDIDRVRRKALGPENQGRAVLR